MQKGVWCHVAETGRFYRQELVLTQTLPEFSISTHRQVVHLKSKERMDAAYKRVNGTYGTEAEKDDQGTRVNNYNKPYLYSTFHNTGLRSASQA